MKFNLKALALTGALIWGILAVFLCGIANLIWPAYAKGFLELLASVYPGYSGAASFGQVLIATGYGLVDGAVALLVFGWLYNKLSD
ncbi:MAG: hypothetical protein ACE5H2_02220 [Terriglobia bacterium]